MSPSALLLDIYYIYKGELNIMANKVPCGGFILGDGLSLGSDGVTVSTTGGSGSNGVFVVNIALGDNGLIADKTNEQIQEACLANKIILPLDSQDGVQYIFGGYLQDYNFPGDEFEEYYTCASYVDPFSRVVYIQNLNNELKEVKE